MRSYRHNTLNSHSTVLINTRRNPLRTITFLTTLLIAACAKPLPPGGSPEPTFSLPTTKGGRGGRVLTVKNLNAEGPGSLQATLQTPGPRIIVFEVGGVIDLARRTLTIDEPFVTIAGQTAPSPGITLIRGSILVTSLTIAQVGQCETLSRRRPVSRAPRREQASPRG